MKNNNAAEKPKRRRNQPIKCVCYMNGVPMGDRQFTPEEIQKMSENLSRNMSEYYTQHPEEWEGFKSASWPIDGGANT